MIHHSSIPALLKYRDYQAICLALENAANHLYRVGATDNDTKAMRFIDSIRKGIQP